MLTRKRIGLFLTSFLVWVLLAGVSAEELILGTVVSFIIAMLFGKISNYSFDVKWLKNSIKFIFLYIPIFIIELIKANVDVLLRVLNPKLPINPGFIRVPTELKGDFEKLTLSNSITLTPGTITLDADDNSLYVHCIDVKRVEGVVDYKSVSEPFEKILGRVFK